MALDETKFDEAMARYKRTVKAKEIEKKNEKLEETIKLRELIQEAIEDPEYFKEETESLKTRIVLNEIYIGELKYGKK